MIRLLISWTMHFADNCKYNAKNDNKSTFLLVWFQLFIIIQYSSLTLKVLFIMRRSLWEFSSLGHIFEGLVNCSTQYSSECNDITYLILALPKNDDKKRKLWELFTFSPVSVCFTVSVSKLNCPLLSFIKSFPLPWPSSSWRPTWTSKDGPFSFLYNSYK